MRLFTLCLLSFGSLLANAQDAERIGEVSTEFKLVGPNHKIIIEAFEDPKISGVTCYLSRPKTGGSRVGWVLRKTGPMLQSPAPGSGQ